ncbi:MAG: hypothetical protein L0Y39_04665, partial [Methylococcaceae bacterium]|nr:hypothetical protein [Methylococcaceae bacterium]
LDHGFQITPGQVRTEKPRTCMASIILRRNGVIVVCGKIQFWNPNTGTHREHTPIISLPESGSHGDSCAAFQYPHRKDFWRLDPTFHPYMTVDIRKTWENPRSWLFFRPGGLRQSGREHSESSLECALFAL